MIDLLIGPATSDDRDAVVRPLAASGGGTVVVTHGRTYDAVTSPALLTVRDGRPVGLLTDEVTGGGLEVVTLDALDFYQRRGLRIVGVIPGAGNEARRIKPSIPTAGSSDIPLHDVVILELLLWPVTAPGRSSAGPDAAPVPAPRRRPPRRRRPERSTCSR